MRMDSVVPRPLPANEEEDSLICMFGKKKKKNYSLLFKLPSVSVFFLFAVYTCSSHFHQCSLSYSRVVWRKTHLKRDHAFDFVQVPYCGKLKCCQLCTSWEPLPSCRSRMVTKLSEMSEKWSFETMALGECTQNVFIMNYINTRSICWKWSVNCQPREFSAPQLNCLS